MKRLIQTFVALVLIIGSAIIFLYLTGNGHVVRGFQSTYLVGKSRPDIDDMNYFDLRKVTAGDHQPWPEALNFEDGILSEEDLAYLAQMKTSAFLVVYRDTLVYEYYGEGSDRHTLSNSFSMAKSFTSLAIGAAADRSIIKIGGRVGQYLPRFNEGNGDKLTIRQLLQMRSNINFGESYGNPFGYMARAYFGKDLRKLTAPFQVSSYPGTVWKYEGGNTVILSEILDATTNRTLSDWFSSCYWQKIGAEHDAYWNLDHEDGLEKSFSGFYATARDFARIGKLMLHNGRWEGVQIISGSFIEASLQPANVVDERGDPVQHYGYHWWLAPHSVEPWHFSARGMRGQYITVIPSHDLVLVRLGHERDETETETHITPDLTRWVEMALKFTH